MANDTLEDKLLLYRWLGKGRGFTHMIGWHKDYKPGRDKFLWNKEHRTLPVVSYAQNEGDVKQFIQRNEDEHSIHYGLNPVLTIPHNDRGYERSPLEQEIEVARNIALDLRFRTKDVNGGQRAAAGVFFQNELEPYFQDLGIRVPLRVSRDRGYYVLFSHPAISVRDVPDIGKRQQRFAEEFNEDLGTHLNNLELKLIHKPELNRTIEVARPGKVEEFYRFYGGKSFQDEQLAKYIQTMKIPLEEYVAAE